MASEDENGDLRRIVDGDARLQRMLRNIRGDDAAIDLVLMLVEELARRGPRDPTGR